MQSSPITTAGQAFSVVLAGSSYLNRARRRQVRRPRLLVSLTGWGVLGLLLSMLCLVFDVPASQTLRALPAPLLTFFEAITDIGLAGVTLWPSGLALLLGAVFLGLRPKPWPWAEKILALLLLRLAFVFIAVAGSGLVVTAVKRVFGRARPWVSPDNAVNFELLTLKSQFVSFPSGHATAITAGAVALALLFPRLKWPLAAIAVLVCISRVVVGAHFPTDVIAGAAFGASFAIGTWRWFAARALVFPASGGQAAAASTEHLVSRLASAVRKRRQGQP